MGSKSNIETNKIVFRLIFLSNLIFIFLFLTIFYYDRIASDDFYFLGNLTKNGILKGLLVERAQWSGRWAALLLNQIVLSFYAYSHFLLIYGICIAFLFTFSIKRLVHYFLDLIKSNKLSSWKEIQISIFIFSALFYTTFKIDETWFWLCSSTSYLASTAFFILGASALISTKKKMSNTLLIVFSYAYIGGACEPFALISMLMLLVFGVLIFKNLISINLPREWLSKRIVLAIVFCLLSFLIVYSAEGNKIRAQFFHEISLGEALLLNIKTTGMILLLRIPPIIPFLIVFSIPAYYIGKLNAIENENSVKVWKKIAFIGCCYFAVVFIYQYPLTYITQDIGAFRTLIFVSLISLIATFLTFYYLGTIPVVKQKVSSRILFFSLLSICILNAYYLIFHLTILPKYAKAYDQRLEYIMENKESSTALIVAPLPESGFLYSAEISVDSTHFTNIHLSKGLGLNLTITRSP